MDKTYLKDSNNITYADLSEGETAKLKEFEQTFNKHFQCNYYLMVMKDDNIKS